MTMRQSRKTLRMAIPGNKGLNLSHRMVSGKKAWSIFQAMIPKTKATTTRRSRMLHISKAIRAYTHTRTHMHTHIYVVHILLASWLVNLCSCHCQKTGISNVYLYLFITTNKITVPQDILWKTHSGEKNSLALSALVTSFMNKIGLYFITVQGISLCFVSFYRLSLNHQRAWSLQAERGSGYAYYMLLCYC